MYKYNEATTSAGCTDTACGARAACYSHLYRQPQMRKAAVQLSQRRLLTRNGPGAACPPVTGIEYQLATGLALTLLRMSCKQLMEVLLCSIQDAMHGVKVNQQ
jgi:hypothetical protein